ncbi:hypothetical protein ACOSQ3_024040 [Xanthoceras sorbifolium]
MMPLKLQKLRCWYLVTTLLNLFKFLDFKYLFISPLCIFCSITLFFSKILYLYDELFVEKIASTVMDSKVVIQEHMKRKHGRYSYVACKNGIFSLLSLKMEKRKKMGHLMCEKLGRQALSSLLGMRWMEKKNGS